MEIVRDYPPIFDEIDERFHTRGKPVIYAWGDRIFNPMGVKVDFPLFCHEKVHGARQIEGGSIEDWWRRYIAEDEFRLHEEILAHQAEYNAAIRDASTRQQRRLILGAVSRKLAAPLYGRLITEEKARRVVKGTYG